MHRLRPRRGHKTFGGRMDDRQWTTTKAGCNCNKSPAVEHPTRQRYMRLKMKMTWTLGRLSARTKKRRPRGKATEAARQISLHRSLARPARSRCAPAESG